MKATEQPDALELSVCAKTKDERCEKDEDEGAGRVRVPSAQVAFGRVFCSLYTFCSLHQVKFL